MKSSTIREVLSNEAASEAGGEEARKITAKVFAQHPAPAPGETPTPRTAAVQKRCGEINTPDGNPYLAWYGMMSDHAFALERENQRLRKALKQLARETQRGRGNRPWIHRTATAALATGGTADAVKEG